MKLSEIRSFSRRSVAQASCILLSLVLLTSAWAQSGRCGPPPDIRAQLEKINVVVASASDFDRGIAPLLALRQRYPQDLWVNIRYQDAVQQYGIEGHLRKLTEEYQVLSMQHPDDVLYSYLYARSLMGRNTTSAVQFMTEIVSQHPDFAPAQGSLAEIYASTAFHDEAKTKTERERVLALCPGFVVRTVPVGLPEASRRVDQANLLLAQHGDPARAAAMADEGIRDDEWRLQRIRPFDWYSVDQKRQAQRDLQAKYWRLWGIQVRCQRLTGQSAKAAELLAVMDQRAASLHSSSDPVYWNAMATLARLYQEGNQNDHAAQKLAAMQEYLTAHPDPSRSAQLEALKKGTEVRPN